MTLPLLNRLLDRGDVVELNQGQIVIEPASGAPVPPQWLQQQRQTLARELAVITGNDLLVYDSYSTGRYGPKKHAGVQLQFQSLLSGEFYYCVFNAELNRSRNSASGKARSPLPKGRFKVGKRSAFYQFWGRTGLKLPPRLSSFHDYMGNLKRRYYFAQHQDHSRLDKSSLRLANIAFVSIYEAIGYPSSLRHNASSIVALQQYDPAVSSTTPDDHDQYSKSQRIEGVKSVPCEVQNQSHEQWLAAYNSTDY